MTTAKAHLPENATGDTVILAIPRSALTHVDAHPATITQRNCERWFGISPKDFMALANRGAFRVNRIKKSVWVASYDDVHEALLTTRQDRNAAKAHAEAKEPTAEDLLFPGRKA